MTPILTVVRTPPTLVVYFDDPRAAMRFGSEYRVQRLYFHSREEAERFAAKHTLGGGEARIESCE